MEPAGIYATNLEFATDKLIKASPIPHTILRSTQFFELISRIAQSSDDGRRVRVSSALVQPIVSDEVAAALADLATAAPRNDIIEIAGPEQLHLDDIVTTFEDWLKRSNATRPSARSAASASPPAAR